MISRMIGCTVHMCGGGGGGGGGVENAEITIAIHPVTNEPGPRTRGRGGARPAFCFILISQ